METGWAGCWCVSLTRTRVHANLDEQLPDSRQYWDIYMGSTFEPQKPMMTTVPISFRLREYHSVNPKTPIQKGGPPKEQPEDFFNDGIMRAWVPDGCELREMNGGVRPHDANGLQIRGCEYVRWQEGQANGHNPTTCKMCIKRDEEVRRAESAKEKKRKSPSDMDDSEDGSMPAEDNTEERGEGRARPKRARARSPSARRNEPVAVEVVAAAPAGAGPADPAGGIDVSGTRIEGHRAELQDIVGPSVQIDDLIDAEMKDSGASAPCDGVQDIILVGEVRAPSHGPHAYSPLCRPSPSTARRGTTTASTAGCASTTGSSPSCASPRSFPSSAPPSSAGTSSGTSTSSGTGAL